MDPSGLLTLPLRGSASTARRLVGHSAPANVFRSLQSWIGPSYMWAIVSSYGSAICVDRTETASFAQSAILGRFGRRPLIARDRPGPLLSTGIPKRPKIGATWLRTLQSDATCGSIPLRSYRVNMSNSYSFARSRPQSEEGGRRFTKSSWLSVFVVCGTAQLRSAQMCALSDALRVRLLVTGNE